MSDDVHASRSSSGTRRYRSRCHRTFCRISATSPCVSCLMVRKESSRLSNPLCAMLAFSAERVANGGRGVCEARADREAVNRRRAGHLRKGHRNHVAATTGRRGKRDSDPAILTGPDAAAGSWRPGEGLGARGRSRQSRRSGVDSEERVAHRSSGPCPALNVAPLWAIAKKLTPWPTPLAGVVLRPMFRCALLLSFRTRRSVPGPPAWRVH